MPMFWDDNSTTLYEKFEEERVDKLLRILMEQDGLNHYIQFYRLDCHFNPIALPNWWHHESPFMKAEKKQRQQIYHPKESMIPSGEGRFEKAGRLANETREKRSESPHPPQPNPLKEELDTTHPSSEDTLLPAETQTEADGTPNSAINQSNLLKSEGGEMSKGKDIVTTPRTQLR